MGLAPRCILAALVPLFVTPVAQADTYTVPIPGSAASLQATLNQAGAHGGDDTVVVPAGTYTGQFDYTYGNPVQIVGVSRTTTKLTLAVAGTTLNLHAPSSSVHKLSLAANGPSTSYALQIPQGGTLDEVEIRATGTNTFGVSASANTTVTNTLLVVSTGNTAYRQNGGKLTMSDSALEGTGDQTTGIEPDSAAASADVARLVATGVRWPLSAAFSASLNVHDSLVVLPTTMTGIALRADDSNNSLGAHTSSIQADRLTVVGTPTQTGQTGARVAPAGAGDNFQIHVRDSVFVGVAIPLYCEQQAAGGSGTVTADWSSLPAGGDLNTCTSGTLTRTNAVLGTPLFLNAGAGDYRLPWNSPLVDAGDPAALLPTLDLAQLPRPVGRRDVGAFEYQRRPPVVSAGAAPGSLPTGAPVAFTATASDPDPGDSPLVYSWLFDDGGTATGLSATHAFATAGTHSGTVTVTDPAGVAASATASVQVLAVQVLDETSPLVAGFRFAPKRFHRGRSLPKLFASLAHRTNIRFSLSEAASVRVRFLRRSHGRYRKVRGSIRVQAEPGASRIRFSGRLSRRRQLRPGLYRAVLVAKDPAGNSSAKARARFTLLR